MNNQKICFNTKDDIKIHQAYEKIKRYYYAMKNRFPPHDKEFDWFKKRYGDDVLQYGWDYVLGATCTAWDQGNGVLRMGLQQRQNNWIRIIGEPRI